MVENSTTINFPECFRLLVNQMKTLFENMLKNIYKELGITKLVTDQEIIARMDKGRELEQTPQSFYVLGIIMNNTDFIIFAFMFRHIYKLYILKTGVLNFQGCKYQTLVKTLVKNLI